MSQKKATTSFWEGVPGLNTGTLSIRFIDISGNILIPQTTAGIVDDTGNGSYSFIYTEPNVGYSWIWDDGTDQDEGLFITPTIVTAPGTTTAAQQTSTTIRQRFSIGTPPVLTDMQSVTFGDSSGTLGVVRTDTNTNVVSPGTALVHESTGVYSLTFNDPAFGLTYTYYITVVTPGGVTDYVTGTYTNTGLPVSAYFNYAAFVRRFGFTNVVMLSQKDNYDKKNPVPNWLALQDAFAYADDEINSAFRDGIYSVPLDFTPNNGAIPPVVSNWGMAIAMGWLYESRGLDEVNRSNTRFEKIIKRVYDDMSMYRVGLRRFNATLATNLDQSMAVVTTTDVRLSRGDNSPSMLVITDATPIFLHP